MPIYFVLAVAAIAASVLVPFVVEALERPRLEIGPSPWIPAGPTPWTFAIVQVCNKPLAGPLAMFLTRQAAQACVADIDYFRWGTGERVMPTMHGRWTSRQELMAARVSKRTTGRRCRDIPVGRAGEIVAVAILSRGQAFAFSTASYLHDGLGNPAWRLDRGTYRIDVQVRGSSVDHRRSFKLEYFGDDFTQFRLEIILMLPGPVVRQPEAPAPGLACARP